MSGRKIIEGLEDAVKHAKRMSHRDVKIHETSWRIAIRQADMLIRRERDRARAKHSLKNGRLTKAGEVSVSLLDQLAEEVWNSLREPPNTVGDAYDWDEKIEAEWPAVRRLA